MDKRNRPAEKRYRESSENKKYITTSFTLNKDVLDFIEKRSKLEEENNKGKFIEENVSKNIKLFSGETTKKRKHGKMKKAKITSTFNDYFIKEIKSYGNMSLVVEEVLRKAFDI